jgi:hypothetical protein
MWWSRDALIVQNNVSDRQKGGKPVMLVVGCSILVELVVLVGFVQKLVVLVGFVQKLVVHVGKR